MCRARKRKNLACVSCPQRSATSSGWSKSRISTCRRAVALTSAPAGKSARFCCEKPRKCDREREWSLSEAIALFSAKLWDVPEQIRKSLEESKLLRKQKEDVLDELAELMALAALHSQAAIGGRKIIVRVFSDRDVAFAKLFAQKLTRAATPAIALVASVADPPGLVFAQTPGGVPGSAADMGALLKQVLSSVGGRGGGSRDFAQGGVPAGSQSNVEQLLREAADTI